MLTFDGVDVMGDRLAEEVCSGFDIQLFDLCNHLFHTWLISFSLQCILIVWPLRRSIEFNSLATNPEK